MAVNVVDDVEQEPLLLLLLQFLMVLLNSVAEVCSHGLVFHCRMVLEGECKLVIKDLETNWLTPNIWQHWRGQQLFQHASLLMYLNFCELQQDVPVPLSGLVQKKKVRHVVQHSLLMN